MKRLLVLILLLTFAFFMACDKSQNPTGVDDNSAKQENLLHKRGGTNPEPLSINLDTARRVKPATDNRSFKYSDIPANGTLRKVPSSDYPSIQDAVNAAVPGDKVEIAAGDYWEDVFVFVPGIRITAANDGLTTIHGSFMIYFNAYVMVDNLIFNGDSGPYAGFDVWYSNDVQIKNCRVTNHLFGFWFDNSAYCTVKNGSAWGNLAGLYLTDGGGHKIKGNSFSNNSDYGIYTSFALQNDFNRNNCNYNGYRGMFMYWGDGSWGDANTFNNNGPSSASVRLYDTWSTTWSNTNSDWNNADGLHLDISNYNTFTDLNACNNDGVPFVDNGYGNSVSLDCN